MIRLFIASVLLAVAVNSAQAVPLVLFPSNVIGSSGAYDSRFIASRILDQQSGPVTDISGSTYWLNFSNSGAAQVYITIDLGAAFQINQLTLFNTHNDAWFDRGTGGFTVVGANAVTDIGGGNFRVSGPTSTLVAGFLSAVGVAVPPANSFAVSDPGSYRYLSFTPVSVASFSTAAGPTAYGLNELRVGVVAVPELGRLLLLVVGTFFMAGAASFARSRAA